jgi:hypothetical protein
MPSFSQSFLASLGQPRFAQGMFDVGQAIGGIGGQLAEKKRREAEAQELAGLSPDSAEYYQTLARQSEARGDREMAIKYGALAKQAKRQEAIIGASQGMFGDLEAQRQSAKDFAGLGMTREAAAAEKRVTEEEVNRGKTALARYMQSISAKGEDLTSSKVKEGFDRVARAYGVPFEDSQDIYKSFEREPEVSSAQAVSLVGRFTPESIDRFISSGSVSDLDEIEEPFVPKNVRTVTTNEGVFLTYLNEDNRVVKQKIGEPEAEEPKAAVDAFQTRWASNLLQNERELERNAGVEVQKIDNLITEVRSRAFWERGLLGKTIADAEQALGVGGSTSARISRLNEIRMSKALSFLPKGPASDRDVQLALDATVDINSLSNEAAESYLRGLKKIAQAEKDYHSAKANFMINANDPNALGFDQWASKKEAERDFSDLNSKAPGTVQGVLKKITQANALENPAQRAAALEKMAQEFPEIYGAISNLESARNEWQAVKSQYTNLQGIY